MTPAGIVTLVGVDIVAADVDVEPIDTTEPPDGAGPERAILHWDEPGAITDVGAQDRLLSETEAGALLIVIVAPAPVAETAAAAPEVALALSTLIVLEVDVVVLESVKLAVAIVPLDIAVVFKPLARQTYCPEAGELQETLFPAPVAAAPAVTDTLLKSAGV